MWRFSVGYCEKYVTSSRPTLYERDIAIFNTRRRAKEIYNINNIPCVRCNVNHKGFLVTIWKKFRDLLI
jgi:hypothetical protein